MNKGHGICINQSNICPIKKTSVGISVPMKIITWLKILNRNAILYTMPGPCTGGPLVYPGVLNQLPCFPAPSAAFKFSGDLL